MARALRLCIGGIVLALASADDGSEFEVDEAYVPFVCDDEAEVMLRVQRRLILDQELGEIVFDSGGPWRLHQDQKKWGIHIGSPARGLDPYQVAILEGDFRSGDIYVKVQRPAQDLLLFPLRHPLAELLMVNLLSLRRGVLLHACGISDEGRGIVFVGTSGAGKSTLAELWKNQKGITILSDDRIVVRQKEGRFWAYGTPWHGDARVCSPESVPLDAVFLIRHGEENTAVRLEAGKAVPHLLARSFPTFWNAEGMAFTLEFLSRLSEEVPCYDLGFLPDKSIVQFVRSVDYGWPRVFSGRPDLSAMLSSYY